MKKFLIGIAVVIVLAAASIVSVSAAHQFEATEAVAMVESSAPVCTGPKPKGGECKCESAESCRDKSGCGSYIIAVIVELFE